MATAHPPVSVAIKPVQVTSRDREEAATVDREGSATPANDLSCSHRLAARFCERGQNPAWDSDRARRSSRLNFLLISSAVRLDDLRFRADGYWDATLVEDQGNALGIERRCFGRHMAQPEPYGRYLRLVGCPG